MKILQVKIYSPDSQQLRVVDFNENGLSIIFGDVEKPNNENETSNSIGKTVLLKIINVIFGGKNSGKDTIRGLKDYKVKACVKYNELKYKIDLTIGNSKNYYVNNQKMNLNKYKEFFNIDRSKFSKQIMLEKRKGLISTYSPNATKDDCSTVLSLLYLEEIEKVFRKIKKNQDEIEIMGKFKNSFKEDVDTLQKEEFNLEMKKKQADDELYILNDRIKTLKISDNIEEIVHSRTELDQKIKNIGEKIKLNEISIGKYKEIQIPDMIKKKLDEVEEFYKCLIEDKKDIYQNQIQSLANENEKMQREMNDFKIELDKFSEIISENDSFREAIKIYDIKTREKMEIDSKISEINGKLAQISNTQNLKSEIDILYMQLYKEFEEAILIINNYKEFVYNIVNRIYGEEKRNPYLSINVPNISRKYKAMPVKIDLTIDGDDGEGINAVKYLLFDLLIFNYNNDIEFLIEDSACFEGIDRRQIKNMLIEMEKISKERNKQLIISLNKYLISDIDALNNSIVLKLNENDTLINIKF
jgi:uncharacterized protein YydD (DUF2326 family)